MSYTHHSKGLQAEKNALKILRADGLKLITRNFHSRYGEIDIIMRSAQHIIFVEVKMRTNITFGEPIEFVTYQKQQKIIQTAHIFLQQHTNYQALQPRFDIIGITPKQSRWIKNAFSTN